MKRAFSISVLLLSLCVLLTACGKVRNAEKLIDDMAHRLKQPNERSLNSTLISKQRLRTLIFLKKQNSNMPMHSKSKKRMMRK